MIGVFTFPEKQENFTSPFKGRTPSEISFINSYNEPMSLIPNEPINEVKDIPKKQAAPSAKNSSMLANALPSLREVGSAKIMTKRHVKAAPTVNHLQKLKTIFKAMLEASYKTPQEASQTGQRYGLVFDTQLSNDNTYVYYDTETGFPLITHRGSTTLIDWLVSDPLILTGMARVVMPRVTTAKEIVKQVEGKYKRPSDSFSHSLGGYIAEESGANGYILTYNKAAGLGDIRKKTNPKQIDYRSYADIVSLIAETQDTNIKYIENNKGLLYSHSTDILPEVQNRRV